MKKVMLIFGTRPEAIKMAPVIFELNRCTKIESVVVSSFQHKEMLSQVIKTFKIKLDYSLNIMTKNQKLEDVTCLVLTRLAKVIAKEQPDILLVQGDTTTAFAASLCAFYNKVPVGHIEAGLRTNNKCSPYPEELNRCFIDYISDFHFAPTSTAKDNLIKEGLNKQNIFVVGNTVIDSLYWVLKQDFQFHEEKLKNINFDSGRVIFVTAHRRESWDKSIFEICLAVLDLIKKYSDAEIIFSYHLNPVVQKIVRHFLEGKDRIHLVPPLFYTDVINIIKKSHFILTDSGGIQEEAPYLGKPVLVMREVTERPEVVKKGVSRIVGIKRENIVECASELLDSSSAYNKMAKVVKLYGDGKTASKIVKTIIKYLKNT